MNVNWLEVAYRYYVANVDAGKRHEDALTSAISAYALDNQEVIRLTAMIRRDKQ